MVPIVLTLQNAIQSQHSMDTGKITFKIGCDGEYVRMPLDTRSKTMIPMSTATDIVIEGRIANGPFMTPIKF